MKMVYPPCEAPFKVREVRVIDTKQYKQARVIPQGNFSPVLSSSTLVKIGVSPHAHILTQSICYLESL